MEDQIAEFAQIAFLGGDFDGVAVSNDSAPAAKAGRQRRRQLVGLTGDRGVGMLGQPGQVARGGHWVCPHGAGMLDHPRCQTAEQRHEQQRVDGGEPETAEHIERLHPIQPRPDLRVGDQIVGDLAGVEAALRQQRAGHRAQRQQE